MGRVRSPLSLFNTAGDAAYAPRRCGNSAPSQMLHAGVAIRLAKLPGTRMKRLLAGVPKSAPAKSATNATASA